MKHSRKAKETTFLIWAKKEHPIIARIEEFGEVERISPLLVRISCLNDNAGEIEDLLFASGLRWAEE